MTCSLQVVALQIWGPSSHTNPTDYFAQRPVLSLTRAQQTN